jgi:alpha-mannosidase
LDKLGFKDKDNIDDELVALNTLPWNRTELVKLPIKSERPKYAIASGTTGAMTVTELTAATESPASITEISKGVFQLTNPHRVSVTTETKISKDSWIKSTISLDALVDDANSQISIETEVEWRENMKFLKVEFPVDITNTEASYESQYGMIKRPTHYNTSWDAAKFEVCCHKWADLSEAGYGVSILNDSKYGFATIGKLMRLSLLRAPKAPDAHADMGRHHIRYAILPHSGPLDHRTVRAGYNFNNPLQLHRHSSPSSIASVMAAIRIEGPPGLIVDCIKRGEDDEDIAVGLFPPRKGRSIIIRIFDSLGGKTNAKLVWGSIPVKKANITNVLEDDGEELKLAGDGTSTDISLRAFEVLTIRLQL